MSHYPFLKPEMTPDLVKEGLLNWIQEFQGDEEVVSKLQKAIQFLDPVINDNLEANHQNVHTAMLNAGAVIRQVENILIKRDQNNEK